MSRFELHLVAALFVVLTGAFLVVLQLEGFWRFHRAAAISALVFFFGGAAGIYYVEEIKAFIWDDHAVYTPPQAGNRAAAGWGRQIIIHGSPRLRFGHEPVPYRHTGKHKQDPIDGHAVARHVGDKVVGERVSRQGYDQRGSLGD